jgi:hypothetical protein
MEFFLPFEIRVLIKNVILSVRTKGRRVQVYVPVLGVLKDIPVLVRAKSRPHLFRYVCRLVCTYAVLDVLGTS